MDYEGENSDEDSDEDEGTGEILSERYSSGVIPNQQAVQEDLTDRLRSLEEEVATLRKQIIEAGARAALAEQGVKEATRETSEMAEHLVCHFGI